MDFGDDGFCKVDVELGICRLSGFENSVKMMWDDRSFGLGRSSANDFESLIELECVGVDDLAIVLERVLDGETAFPRSGGTTNVERNRIRNGVSPRSLTNFGVH